MFELKTAFNKTYPSLLVIVPYISCHTNNIQQVLDCSHMTLFLTVIFLPLQVLCQAVNRLVTSLLFQLCMSQRWLWTLGHGAKTVSLESFGSANCFINLPPVVSYFMVKCHCPALSSRPKHAEHNTGFTCRFTIQDVKQIKHGCVNDLILNCKQLWFYLGEWVGLNGTWSSEI